MTSPFEARRNSNLPNALKLKENKSRSLKLVLCFSIIRNYKKIIVCLVRFELLAPVTMKLTVFQEVTPIVCYKFTDGPPKRL
jgi:hypothetical protein